MEYVPSQFYCESCESMYDGNSQCCMELDHVEVLSNDSWSVCAADTSLDHGDEESTADSKPPPMPLQRQNAVSHISKSEVGKIVLTELLRNSDTNMSLFEFNSTFKNTNIDFSILFGDIDGSAPIIDYVKSYIFGYF